MTGTRWRRPCQPAGPPMGGARVPVWAKMMTCSVQQPTQRKLFRYSAGL
jgi:hypothetical protein